MGREGFMAGCRVPAKDSYQSMRLVPLRIQVLFNLSGYWILRAFWRAYSGNCHLPEAVETTGPKSASQSAWV